MEAQRLLQEERVQKAMERAKAPVKKKVISLKIYKQIGKAIVFRSAPPQRKVKKTEDTNKKDEGIFTYIRHHEVCSIV